MNSLMVVGCGFITPIAVIGLLSCSRRFGKAVRVFFHVLRGNEPENFEGSELTKKKISKIPTQEELKQIKAKARLAAALADLTEQELKDQDRMTQLTAKMDKVRATRDKIEWALGANDVVSATSSLENDFDVMNALRQNRTLLSQPHKMKTAAFDTEHLVQQLQKKINKAALEDDGSGFTKEGWSADLSVSEIRKELMEKGLKNQQIDEILSKLEFYFES